MKKFYMIFAMAAVAAAFASCNKVETLNQPAENQISIRVGTESKTILRKGTEVHWSSYDQIRVFDTNNDGFRFTTEQSDVATATFTCAEEGGWTGGVPVMAIHSYRGSINQTEFDGTKVTAQMNHNQVIQNNQSYARDASLSIGVVGQDGGDYVIDEMKNCFSLIKFQLENKDITSVKVRGNNNEVLAGWVKVSYNDGAPTWEVDGENGQKEITITPGGKNAGHSATKTFFSVDDTNDDDVPVVGTYYIAVLPQTLSAGLTLEIEKTGGLVATRTIDAAIVLNRSKIKEFQAPIDHDLNFVKGNIVLDCTDASKFRYGNPATGLVARTNTIYDPEKGGTVLEPFDFWLEGSEDYKFYGQVTNWSGNLSGVSSSYGDPKIKLPTIDGYVLASVQITYSHSTSNRTYTVTDGENTFASCTMTRSSDPVTLNLTNPAFTPVSNDRYLQYSSELGAKFILTYTPEGSEPEPEPDPNEIVINCLDFSQVVDGDGNGLLSRTNSIYSTVTEAFDFWFPENPQYVFNGQVSNWQKHLSAKSRTLVKLPKISGYVLTEVNITSSYSSSNRTYIVTDGTADTELDPPYVQLGKVLRNSASTEETKINLTGVAASTDERYLTSPGEMCGKFILTYTKVTE